MPSWSTVYYYTTCAWCHCQRAVRGTYVWTAVREAARSDEEVGKKDPVAVCFRVVLVVVVVVARREHVHVFSINRERDDGTTRAHKSA